MKPRVLILGYGKLGQAFSRLYPSEYEIRGVKRSLLPGDPASVVQMPIQSEALVPHLKWSEIVIFSPSSGGGDLDQYKDAYLGNLSYVIGRIRAHAVPVRSFILIGSTGVYPKERGGTWTEETPIPSETPRQEILLTTERPLIESGLPYVILRCGGLYGEGRGNFRRIIQAGRIRSSEMTEQFLPLVHQDDVCGVVHRVIESGQQGAIYNVLDDSNLSRRELYTWIAREAGVRIEDSGPPPKLPERTIPNAKLKRELQYEFRCPRVTTFLKGFLGSK